MNAPNKKGYILVGGGRKLKTTDIEADILIMVKYMQKKFYRYFV